MVDRSTSPKVAALFVDPSGPYYGREDVEPWGEDRDARVYAGPWPVVAHPPCARWGRFAYRGETGADGGCFEAAVRAVEKWGGVLEHPEASLAWDRFRLPRPESGRWTRGLFAPGWSCQVDQAAYGHKARKRTWLYYVGEVAPAPLDFRPAQGVAVVAANERSRRLGIPKLPDDETHLTPPAFADVLLALARGSRVDVKHS